MTHIKFTVDVELKSFSDVDNNENCLFFDEDDTIYITKAIPDHFSPRIKSLSSIHWNEAN